MNQLRSLLLREKAVIAALLQSKPVALPLIDSLDELHVGEMNDGGMGSLLLVPKDLEGKNRSLGQQLVLGEFTDTDGVPVSLALNLDSNGNLYELDLWRVDFSPLLKWPISSQVRIVA